MATYTLAGGVLDATSITVASGSTFNFNGGRLAVDKFNGNLVNKAAHWPPVNHQERLRLMGAIRRLSMVLLRLRLEVFNRAANMTG